MRRWWRHAQAAVWLLLLIAAGLGLAGCASPESETMSERPWNAPKGWETGIPSTMTEGR